MAIPGGAPQPDPDQRSSAPRRPTADEGAPHQPLTNQLASSLSPYLRQHADNPVAWQEWGPGAFDLARRLDRPILLSVGYAACHWCHVMAHESFEDAEVASLLNGGFVSVKVDREERPDVDAAYMAATQALTGSGGWPMTCLLTPDGDPFFAATYLPRAHLLDLLQQASELWRTQRDGLEQQAAQVVAHLSSDPGAGPADASAAAEDPASMPTGPLAPSASTHSTPSETDLDAAVERLARQFDPVHAGFGGAPKFPPSMVLEFLARHAARTGSQRAQLMLVGTLEQMARGGIHDQLAGGFARYSVDARWRVPHFEKMLYDNAQLARVYAHAWRLTGEELFRRVALDTCWFMVRDLGTPTGFASSLDADSAGVEGLTYVWTPTELVSLLGDDDGRRAAALLDVTERGSFEHGSSTLTLRHDPDDADWWAGVRERLLAARSERPQPGRDDKVVSGWNGLAIAALADCGVLFDRPELVQQAVHAAEQVTARHVVDGRLRRASLGAVVSSAPAMLDDHGDLAEGLLALHQATGDPRWLAAAGDLLDDAARHFRDGRTGTWYDSPDDADRLFRRARSEGDNAEPSGVSAVAGALLTHAALTGDVDERVLAEQAIGAGARFSAIDPRFAGWALAQAEAALAGPLQVAVVGASPDAEALLQVARSATSPGLVVAHGVPDADGVPLLADRPLVDGRPAAYVCRGMVCDLPVGSPDELARKLAPGT